MWCSAGVYISNLKHMCLYFKHMCLYFKHMCTTTHMHHYTYAPVDICFKFDINTYATVSHKSKYSYVFL